MNNTITYKVGERIEQNGFEKALIIFAWEYLGDDKEISREEKFMKAIEDGWKPIIQTDKQTWASYEFLMKRKLQ